MATASDSSSLLAGSVRSMTAAVRNAGLAMTVMAGAVGAGMLSLSLRAERVNEKFREIATITDTTNDTQSKYGEIVSDVNTQLGVQGDKLDVLEGLYQSISAGVDESAESQREFLTTASKLSVVGRTELATTVDVLSTSINAYGEDTEFAKRASNALFRTVQLGKVTLDELAPVMGRITALGSEMGVSIEELGSSMALLTRTGFEARIAATGVRAILRGLMKPSEQMQSMLRDLALEQNLFAESSEESSSQLRNVAENYRNAEQAVRQYAETQRQARENISETNLAIQRTRLALSAIQENRVAQLEDEETRTLALSNSKEQLENRIEQLRFQTKEYRIEQEEARQSEKDAQKDVEELEERFKSQLSTAGNLGSGIGRLVVENEGLVSTLTKLRERANETGVGFDKLFPRTRGLQAALALVGEDAEKMNQIFQDFKEGKNPSEELRQLAEDTDVSVDELRELEGTLSSVSDEYEESQGPIREWRNAISRVKESLTELGEVFVEDTFGTVTNFADKVSGLVEDFKSLDESTRTAISQIGILGVSIGLVLGPLLFFGGQIALIASTFSLSLIPILLVAIVVFALISAVIKEVTKNSEDSSSTVETLSNFWDDLVSALKTAYKWFNNNIQPVLQDIAEWLVVMGEEINSAIEEAQDSEIVQTLFKSIASDVKDAVNAFIELAEVIAKFVSSDAFIGLLKVIGLLVLVTVAIIASLVSIVADLVELLNPVLLPALKALAVLLAIAIAPLIVLLAITFVLIKAIEIIVGVIVKLLNKFEILKLVLLVIVGVLLIAVSAFIGAIAGPLVALGALIVGVALLIIGAVNLIVGAFEWLWNFLVGNSILPDLISYLTSWVKKFIGLFVSLVQFVIGLWLKWVKFLIGIFLSFIDGIVNLLPDKFQKLVDKVAELFGGLIDDALEFGKELVKNFAEGITDKLGAVGDAAKGIADKVASYLPSSPAEQGPFSGDGAPSERGKSTSEGFAEGLEDGEVNIDESMEGLGDEEMSNLDGELSFDDSDFSLEDLEGEIDGEGLGMGQSDEMSVSEMTVDLAEIQTFNIPEVQVDVTNEIPEQSSEEVNINERAVVIEEGAFQGVAEEDLPREVQRVVNRNLEELVKEMDGAGRANTTRR